MLSQVASQTLLIRQAQVMAQGYLDQARIYEESPHPEWALALYGQAKATFKYIAEAQGVLPFGEAKSAIEQARTPQTVEAKALRQRIIEVYVERAKLLEKLGKIDKAQASYKRAKAWEYQDVTAQFDREQTEAVEKTTEIEQGRKATIISFESPPVRIQTALPIQTPPVVSSIQDSALLDRLFEKAISMLASLRIPNKPSLFLVYAHDNPTYGRAEADTARYLIEKSSQICVNLYSDQTPLGQPYSEFSRKQKHDGRIEDIVTSQLCLLPTQLIEDVTPVDKVVVCCSEVLGNYLKWPDYQEFYEALQAAYAIDQATYRTNSIQARASAIRDVVETFSQKPANFHHVLTEMAFLQIREAHLKDQHGIISVPLTPQSHASCLEKFIQNTAVRIGDIPRIEVQVEAGQQVYPNQSRHKVLFKLIERLLVGNDEAKTLLDKFWLGYDNLVARLKEATSTLGALEFDKLVEDIFQDFRTALLRQLALIVQESQETQKQALQAADEPLAILGDSIKQFKRAYQESLKRTGESHVLSMYVPLQGIKRGQQGEQIVDLDAELERFFASEASVFLLLGVAGSGKSTFNRHLALKKLTDYQHLSQTSDGRPLVFFIELRNIENPNKQVIQQFLQSKGFAPEQIEALRMHSHQRCIFIFDGYDEIKERNRNFYELNELWQWENAKFVITSRPEYLDANYHMYFCPKALPQALWEMSMAPFSSAQRTRYIQHYVEKNHSRWSVAQYEQALNQLAQLSKELERPVVLRMLFQILPELELTHQDTKRLTLSAVYEQYFQHWWKNWQARLSAIPLTPDEEEAKRSLVECKGGFVPQGFTFMQSCALALTKVGLTTAQDSDRFEKRYPEVYKAFFEESAKTRLLRFNAPLQIKQRQYYAFSHKSMQEYLIVRAICPPKFEEAEPHLEDELNQLPIINEPVILDFLVEQVKAQPLFKAYLHAWIERSKVAELSVTVGAANAITVLIKAGVQFNSSDLQGIRIPGADLSYGVFDSAQLQRADLSNTDLTGTWLRNADLTGARMDEVQFGELPGLQLKSSVSACCYSPDGRYLVVVTYDEIALYEVETLAHVHTFKGHTEGVTSVVFSNDGQTLVSGSYDKTMRLWSVDEKKLLHVFEGHTETVTSVAFSSDGQTLASGSHDKTVRLWSVAERKTIYTFKGHTHWVTSVAFSSDDRTLASGSWDKTVQLWSVAEKKLLHTFEGHTGNVESIAFSSDGQILASGSYDFTVRLWSVAEKKPLHTFEGHTHYVRSVAFSSDGQTMASGSYDRTVWLWSVAEKKTLCTFEGHNEEVTSIAFSNDGKTLASGSKDKTVRLWSVVEKKPSHTSEGHTEKVTSVVFLSDGQTLASGSNDKTVRLWSVAEKKPSHTFEGHTSYVESIAISNDSQTLASAGSYGNILRLWSVAEKKLLHTFKGPTTSVNSIAFSSDDQKLASGNYDKTVRLWSVAERELLHTFEGHTDSVKSVVFSNDGKMLASGSKDKTVRLWSVAEKKMLHTFEGHTGNVKSVAFSNDGKMLASGSWDNTVRLWSIISGQCLTVIQGFNGSTNSVAWYTSAEGVWLATGGEDKVIRLWQVHRDGEACHVILHWASAQTTLTVPDMCIQDVIGLSARNTKLLKQRGARGAPCETEEQEARSLLTKRAEALVLTQSAQINSRSDAIPLNLV